MVMHYEPDAPAVLCPSKNVLHDSKETFSQPAVEARFTGCYSRNMRPSDPSSRMHATETTLSADMLSAVA